MQTNLNTEMVPLTQIKPYWRNPRRDDNGQAAAAVKASIQRYGYNVPIVVDEDYVIVTGHVRYRALMLLEVTEVPVVVASHLSKKQAREFRIADNKTSEFAGWSPDMLKSELQAITSVDDMVPFFRAGELMSALGTVVPEQAGEGAALALASEVQGAEAGSRAKDGPDPKAPFRELSCPICDAEIEITVGEIMAMLVSWRTARSASEA